jgi:hypothetical protein
MIGLNDHNLAILKRYLTATDPESAVKNDLIYYSARYKAGTIGEQQRWREANFQAVSALARGEVVRLPNNEPDHTCNSCLNWTCDRSIVARTDDRIGERSRAYNQVIGELGRVSGGNVRSPYEQDEYVSRRMHEILK